MSYPLAPSHSQLAHLHARRSCNKKDRIPNGTLFSPGQWVCKPIPPSGQSSHPRHNYTGPPPPSLPQPSAHMGTQLPELHQYATADAWDDLLIVTNMHPATCLSILNLTVALRSSHAPVLYLKFIHLIAGVFFHLSKPHFLEMYLVRMPLCLIRRCLHVNNGLRDININHPIF